MKFKAVYLPLVRPPVDFLGRCDLEADAVIKMVKIWL